ncbi:MAG: ketoacyl-ACP synthase III [Alphaproteobacteria bacterium]|nr:ketoacyl-ACP synthase III [Alphaproteobacteria bacterium]
MVRSLIIGCGHYLPEKVVTNHDLSAVLDTSHEWIVERTGIHKRHFAADGELTSDLATAAAWDALKSAGLTPQDIDLIIVATVTPDQTFPSTATIVQSKLGCRGLAFDVSAACSGYILALSTADHYLRLGSMKRALIIGAETFSRIIDPQDRKTYVLFGDGAGAVILRAENNPGNRGILSTSMHSDGSYRDLLYTDGGPSLTGTAGYIRMLGREVFKHAITKLVDSALETLAHKNIAAEELDWLVPHQANIRIIEAIAERLNLSPDRVVITVAEHANTSAASIPLALCKGVSDGRIQPGHLILHEAIGGGFVWGSALIRW